MIEATDPDAAEDDGTGQPETGYFILSLDAAMEYDLTVSNMAPRTIGTRFLGPCQRRGLLPAERRLLPLQALPWPANPARWEGRPTGTPARRIFARPTACRSVYLWQHFRTKSDIERPSRGVDP